MRLGIIAISIALVIAGIEGYIHLRITSGVKEEFAKEILNSQNQAIKAKQIDTQGYITQLPKMEEKIITKYKTIYLKDDSCENKLEEIRNAMDLYFDTHISP